MFTKKSFARFLDARRIKLLLNSSPYYSQANGQDEVMNKVIINMMKQHIEKHSKKWNEKLSVVLRACQTSIKTATGVTLFRLVYGHEAVLPTEIMIPSLRVEKQGELSNHEYKLLMSEESDEICKTRLKALDHLQAHQSRVQNAYNKKLKEKSFSVGDLVLKLTLPINKKSRLYKKWSSNWEGSFQVSRVLKGNFYYLRTLGGSESSKPINEKYLKHYYSSVWEDMI